MILVCQARAAPKYGRWSSLLSRASPRNRRGSEKTSFTQRDVIYIFQPWRTLSSSDVPVTYANPEARHRKGFDQCLMPLNRERVSVLVAKNPLNRFRRWLRP